VPAYMSLPHFLFADQTLLDEVVGLSPDFERHRTIVSFEPLTGIPMKANKRVQINTKIIKNKYIR